MAGCRPGEPLSEPARLPAAVVVVTWNSSNVIRACLESAKAQSPDQIVVVDNGSADGTVQTIKAEFPDVHVVAQGTNTGFAAGCNAGAGASSAPYVLFLNDDAELQPGYLETLIGALDGDSHAASAIGKLVTPGDGEVRIDSAGIELRSHALCPVDRGHGEVDRGQFDTPCEIFGPTGAAALYRRAALEDVGPQFFDEDLFAYYEDVDLAWRLKRRGWRHLYVPQAVAHHGRRGPSGKPTHLAARAFSNRYLVWLKNESFLKFLSYAPVAVPWETARILRRAISEPKLLSAIPRTLLRVPRVLRKRSS